MVGKLKRLHRQHIHCVTVIVVIMKTFIEASVQVAVLDILDLAVFDFHITGSFCVGGHIRQAPPDVFAWKNHGVSTATKGHAECKLYGAKATDDKIGHSDGTWQNDDGGQENDSNEENGHQREVNVRCAAVHPVLDQKLNCHADCDQQGTHKHSAEEALGPEDRLSVAGGDLTPVAEQHQTAAPWVERHGVQWQLKRVAILLPAVWAWRSTQWVGWTAIANLCAKGRNDEKWSKLWLSGNQNKFFQVSKDFTKLTKKRDENDVQKVWIRYFGVLHHQQGRSKEKMYFLYIVFVSLFGQ